MVQTVQDYVIDDLISESSHTLIYRAHKKDNGSRVIIKTLKLDENNPRDILRLNREFELLSKLKSEHIIKVFEIVSIPNNCLLIMEDFDSETLALFIQNKEFDLLTDLNIASNLADALGEIHHERIVHKDVKPQNILINKSTKTIKIIDFGIASFLSRELEEISNPDQIEGSLLYISPEQTGRMNLPIDYRSDIYSLGVTLYQLFTKKLPFEADTPQEIIHAHIAQRPLSPSERDSLIPQAISDIIMKCLSKQPEQRYRSAFGLKKDLIRCRESLLKTNTIPDFNVGEQDIYDHFYVPEKIYGRKKELDFINQCFDEITRGNLALLAVSGYAGVGLTSLCLNAQKQITATRGRFVAVKFDQFNRNTPYSGWIQAFQRIIYQILTESDENLVEWKERIGEALGQNASVIAEIIPQILLIMGEQPSAEKISTYENENRFIYAITAFMRSLLKPERPILIFFDNAQWFDEPSLKLLNHFATDPGIKNLLLMIAYRDNEVGPLHPLHVTLKDIDYKKGRIRHLNIQPLPLEKVQELIKEVYSGPPEQMEGLSKALFHKTKGNPFFIFQFLKYFYEKGLFYFDKEECCWQANLEGIARVKVSDNVADLLIRDFKSMNPSMINLLKVAAAFGNQFSLDILAKVTQLSENEVAQILDEALKNDLIAKETGVIEAVIKREGKTKEYYHFLHDRIQQAAYLLLTEPERQKLHTQIGQILFAITPSEKMQEKCIDIVNHLNRGDVPPQNTNERERLIELNLMAGLKAKDSVAYHQAIQFFQIGIKFQSKDEWELHYNRTLIFYMNLALCQQITGRILQAKELYKQCLTHSKTYLERADIYRQSIIIDSQLQDFESTFEDAVKGVQELGFSFDIEPSKLGLIKDLIALKIRLSFYDLTTLKNLPLATDEKIKTICLIMSQCYYPAFVTGKKTLFLKIALQVINFTLQYGIMPASGPAFATLAMFLGSPLLKDYKKAAEMGLVCFHMTRMFPSSQETRGAVYMYFGLIHRWQNHLKTSILPLIENYKSCLEMGIMSVGAANAVYIYLIGLLTGDKLSLVIENIDKGLSEIRKFKAIAEYLSMSVHREFCLCLKGMTSNPTNPRPPELTDELLAPEKSSKNLLYSLRYDLWHVIALFFFENFEEAKNLSKYVLKKSDNFPNWIEWQVFYFYHTLILAALIQDPSQQQDDWKLLFKEYKLIKRWAKASPLNYSHHELIVRAEIERIKGYHEKAVKTYEQALEAAKANGSTQDLALAYELLGKFYISRGSFELASFFLLRALQNYSYWGADAKCNDLKKRYGEYMTLQSFAIAPQQDREGTYTPSISLKTAHSKESLDLDLNALMKSSQALSKEIFLDKLMESLMDIVIVNAGADKVFLLLEENKKLKIFSEIHFKVPYKPITVPFNLDEADELCISIVKYVARTKQEIILNDATEEGDFRHDPYILANIPKSVLCLPIIQKGQLIGVLYLENRATKGAFTPSRLKLLIHLSSQMAISIENAQFYAKLESKVHERTEELEKKNLALALMQDQLILQEKLKEREILKSKFGKYVPNLKVLDLIIEKGHSLGGEEKEVTVLFCDIWDFTPLSENLTPKETVKLLNRFFTEMVNIATEHKGVVDKFIGDAVMILFGALEPDEIQAQHAVQTAIEMKKKLKEMKGFEVGFGISTGKALMGNLGSEERLEYTAIGDSVNVASRLENLTRQLHLPNGILISDSTRQQLQHGIQVKDRGKILVKGKTEEIQVYEILE